MAEPTNQNTGWAMDLGGPNDTVLGGGLDSPRRRGNLGGMSRPIEKYREYSARAKVILKVAAAMWPFAVTTAATAYNYDFQNGQVY